MKKILLIFLLSVIAGCSFGQAYIAMPADSGAAWRYRIYDIDYITHIGDIDIYLNGKDTLSGGSTYHKLMARSATYVVPDGTIPPVVSLSASLPDSYFGAIREAGQKVYELTGSGDLLLFDFTATIGTAVPAYYGTVVVTAIDSILISGIWHKRYHTTDSSFSPIEGVGSTLGLIPQYNDGGSDMVFYCFTDSFSTYIADTSAPCTVIYHEGYSDAVASGPPGLTYAQKEISIFPNPASDNLHISAANNISGITITNMVGRQVFSQICNSTEVSIDVTQLPSGVYFITINKSFVRKFVKE